MPVVCEFTKEVFIVLRKCAGVALGLVLAAGLLSAEEGGSEPNRWAKLPAEFPNGYNFSALVYAPDRGALLHWGAVSHANGIQPANDVRAFDAGKGVWTSDYASDPNQSWGILGGGSGAAVSYVGRGRMLESGRPYAAMVVNAACYDTKRRRVVYSMPGLMAAYDPAAKQWTDLKATAEVDGVKVPGGPPVFGAGMCYDPLNDEIVMFPHFNAENVDDRAVTGRLSGHFGTFRYSFAENLWKRAGAELGSPEVRAARQAVNGLRAKLSTALDGVWTQQHAPDAAALGKLAETLAACAADAAKLPAPANGQSAAVEAALQDAAAKAKASQPAESLAAGTRAMWALDALLEGKLAVEPPPRAVAPMVYDPQRQAIVLFGGDSNRIRPDIADAKVRAAANMQLNDTWLYDCKTRQWKELSTDARPPAQQQPLVVYDPASGLVLLVTIEGNRWDKRVPRRIGLWSLDVAAGAWSKRLEQPWEGEITDWYSVGLDEAQRKLVVAQTVGAKQLTFALRLDVKALPAEPAPKWTPPPPELPTAIPVDDPAWIAKLKALPANTWIDAKPPFETPRRDWGSIACDPVRGWMVYFGGGHSTYQGTDVAVYAVGANRWIHQAGDNNNSLPGPGWGGYHLGLRGSSPASHQRNSYAALDGRLYQNLGSGTTRHHMGLADGPKNPNWDFKEVLFASYPASPFVWTYDTDRGGVWRQRALAVKGDKPARLLDGRPSVVDASGKVYSLEMHPRQKYDTTIVDAYVSCYDIYSDALTITKVPPPYPSGQPESRPFCLAPDRKQIFMQCYDSKAKKAAATMVYDIAGNKFIDLQPKRQPPGIAAGVAYLEGQNAVLASIDCGARKFEQWVYSFEKNDWAPLPLAADPGFAFQAPYTQMDYVAKYGVLVNFAGRTFVMRPDVKTLAWE